jgi:MFS family permease
MRLTGIVLVACISGWFVMELEILGVRALSPYFGSAVFVVMGSVVGVFLLSLSAGYMLGGWFSRKAGSRRILGFNLLIAGIWLCVMPTFIEPICDGIFDAGLGVKWGSLAAAVALFGAPTVLLGTVTPQAVQWLTSRPADSGLNAGLVLAFSTAASFAGCIIAAFYLVLVSLRQTLRVSGIILIVLGLIIVLLTVLGGRMTTTKDGGSTKAGQ